MDRAQEIVEQSLMPALGYERAQRAGGERRQIDRLQLRRDAARDKIHQGAMNVADLAVMIAAPVGPQWSFVESLRAEARSCRGLSRASTTVQ